MTIDDWRVRYDGLNAETDRLRAEVERLRAEVDRLRVLLATSNANCAFCGLPAAEMAKCAGSFPGCSRADDMILCVHPTRQDLLDEVERLRADADRARWCEENKAYVVWLSDVGMWVVSWNRDALGADQSTGFDRNAAIDAAMKGGK